MGCYVMKRALITIILCVISLAILCNATNVRLGQSIEISDELLNKYSESVDEEKDKYKSVIIKNVLTAINDKQTIHNDITLTVIYGDVAADAENEAIFVIGKSNKDTVIAVYEKKGNHYIYLTKIDNLFKIESIQILEAGEDQKDIIVFREISDQMLGAFESSIFLRAFKWDGGSFKSVFNVIENYNAYWNELWDKVKAPENSHWLNIKQQGESNYIATPVPTVYLKAKQMYLESNKTNSINLPDDSDFQIKNQKEFTQTYYWSNKWNNFIIGEGTELKTGNVVAILEDLSQDPFSLIEQDNRYRIKKSDGNMEVVNKNTIVDLNR